MKFRSLLLFLPLALIVLFTQCEKEPGHVNIPDDAFLNALIELGVDTNGDGIVSPAEAEVITYLDVSGEGISEMTGIEAFVNLEFLDCSCNLITSLDISNNTALRILKINYGSVWICNSLLNELDVSNNLELI